MKSQMILCPMMILLCVGSGTAQSRSERPGSTPGSAAATDIRKTDFLSFTYQSSLCSQEYGSNGIGKAVRVHNGELKNKDVYFAVAADRILYADVTGDGREDAIVPIDCGAITANFALSEVYVYTVENGDATLLAAINDKDLERDYRRHYPDAESYWGIDESGLRVEDGNLEIDVLADGPHASPRHIVTLEYRVSGEALHLIGKPQRRSLGQ